MDDYQATNRLKQAKGQKWHADSRTGESPERTHCCRSAEFNVCSTTGGIGQVQLGDVSDLEGYLWITKVGGRIVGMIGTLCDGRYAAEIRWLRVDPLWRHSRVPSRLLQCVYRHCRQEGYLTVLMGVSVAPPWLLRRLRQQGFEFVRHRAISGQKMLEFYVDPYPYWHPYLPDSRQSTVKV